MAYKGVFGRGSSITGHVAAAVSMSCSIRSSANQPASLSDPRSLTRGLASRGWQKELLVQHTSRRCGTARFGGGARVVLLQAAKPMETLPITPCVP